MASTLRCGVVSDRVPEARSDQRRDDRYDEFPAGFFGRADDAPDAQFYAPVRLVTHIDDGAIAAVGELYSRLGLTGQVLDLMSSWVSHFRDAPAQLTVLGMNETELARNDQAHARVVHDLNADPRLPFADAAFDAVVCCVSVDYLVHPLEVFDEVARALRPDGPFVCTFSNRLFPTKAILGWLHSDDATHCRVVERYFTLATGFTAPVSEQLPTPAGGDPLFAVWARRSRQ